MRKENSGLIDLDALLKEASQPELPKSEEESLEVSAPPPEPPTKAPVEQPPPSPPHPSSSPRPADDSLRSVTTRPRQRPTPIPSVVGLAAAVTVLAFALGIARSSREAPQTASLGASIATAVVRAPEEPKPVAGTSLADLPAVANPSASPSASTPANVARAPGRPPVASSAQLVAIADAPEDTSDLGGAMREAVGSRSTADVAVAAPARGESARQLRPSPGAVVGAINSVMPEARVCLGNSEVVRNATIVFESDGSVARVDIAGAPNVADECIRGALSRARTMPFLADTFAAKATVRP